MGKATQRQIVASIQPVIDTHPKFASYFTTVSGGEISAAVEKVYDGGSQFPEVLCAPAEIGDITVSSFATDDNAAYGNMQSLRGLVGRAYYNVIVATLDCDLRIPGSERTYPNCLLVGLTEPDGDASSGAPSTFSMTFAVRRVDTSPPQNSAPGDGSQ